MDKQKQNDIAVQKMGQLLLKGWKMLEKSCTECSVPFMDNKKGIIIWCGWNKTLDDANKKITVSQPKTPSTNVQPQAAPTNK